MSLQDDVSMETHADLVSTPLIHVTGDEDVTGEDSEVSGAFSGKHSLIIVTHVVIIVIIFVFLVIVVAVVVVYTFMTIFIYFYM